MAVFDADGLVLGSERAGITGNVPRYLRVKLTRSGTAGDILRFAISVVRF